MQACHEAPLSEKDISLDRSGPFPREPHDKLACKAFLVHAWGIGSCVHLLACSVLVDSTRSCSKFMLANAWKRDTGASAILNKFDRTRSSSIVSKVCCLTKKLSSAFLNFRKTTEN